MINEFSAFFVRFVNMNLFYSSEILKARFLQYPRWMVVVHYLLHHFLMLKIAAIIYRPVEITTLSAQPIEKNFVCIIGSFEQNHLCIRPRIIKIKTYLINK